MIKHQLLFALTLSVFILTGCSEQVPEQDIIGKKTLKLASDRLTPEVLWSLGRLGEFEVSPDGKKVIFSITYYDVPQDKSNRDLYIMNTDGQGLLQLTRTGQNEFNATWKPDGSKIGYISGESGSLQIWEMNPDGSGKKRISNIGGGVTGFKYSPDLEKIAYTAEVSLPQAKTAKLYEGLDKTQGKVIDKMMFRHWDEWRETYSHLFITDYSSGNIQAGNDLLEGKPWDVPMKPFWGMEQIDWSPDGKLLVYSCKQSDGKVYAVSTNSDIFLYDLSSGKERNITQGMPGYDLSPSFSPDGSKIAWESMARDGYESDKNRLFIYNIENQTKSNFTESFDQDIHNIAWSRDGESVICLATWYGSEEIFRIELNGTIRQLTNGPHDFISVQPAADGLIASMMSISAPAELYSVPEKGGAETQLTFINKEILDQLTMGKVERRWIETTDKKQMLTWVILPPHFNAAAQYPALLYCQGGPQSMVSQFWSYRWNFQIMAANDYIVVAPNRRGLPGFGQEWKEQISKDYGGQNMLDMLKAIDVVSEEPYVDKKALGAVGASYGGFAVYWLAGNHEKRFRAFIAHDGIFNLEASYLETEEQWFPDFDLGGPFWKTDDPVIRNSYANSPHRFVSKWDTPILIIHGEKDYRIVSTQGMSAFNAAQLLGVPSRLLYFPNENHWVLRPQNGILWQRTFFDWLDMWLKNKQ